MRKEADSKILGIERSARRPEGHAGSSGKTGAIDERPQSVYEVVTRQMLQDLREDVNEIKGRVNALLWLLAGAILVEFVMRLVR